MTHPLRSIHIGVVLALLLSLSSPSQAQSTTPYDSGGELSVEQASYDVLHYDLSISLDPTTQTVEGEVVVTASVHAPLSWFVLDLDPLLTVSTVWQVWKGDEVRLPKEQVEIRGGQIWIRPFRTHQPGETISYGVAYGGSPRIAPNPPWDGGIQWEKTPSGADWIATSCQTVGADVWWPVKDHVSDEPATMDIHIRVPEPLVAASNGRLRDIEQHEDQTRTYHWHVSNPINVYNVALNIAPYRVIEDEMESVAGDVYPIQFYVLPEDYEKGLDLFEEIKDHLAFYEEFVGPYPFRSDKYGVAQTPHLGMEHQTIIAYGAGFDNTSMTRGTDLGFDALHHHELAHEWWGNLVTNSDWSDMWLHEGFGSYMQPLYREYLLGADSYDEAMMQQRRGIRNTKSLAPDSILTSQSIYAGHDIYSKGSWVLHTLRYLVGDETFFTILRRQAYPSPEWETRTDGSQTRFATSEDFQGLAEAWSKQNLSWFFDLYLRQPEVPRLSITRDATSALISWTTPDGLPFPMPIDISIDGKIRRIDVPERGAVITVSESAELVLDPNNRVLRAGNGE